MAGVCVLEARRMEGELGVGVARIFRIPGEEGILFLFGGKRGG